MVVASDVEAPRERDVLASHTFSGLAALLDQRWTIIIVALAWAMPMLLAPVVPLVDLGGHIGRYAIQLDAGRTPELAQWYTFTWGLLPNLGADILVQLVGPIIGVEPAARLVVACAVALQASGILVLSRQVHTRISPWALLALPLIYSFPLHFGFLNFVLSLGLAFWAMVAWVHCENSTPVKRWLVFALVATCVWICHLVGWAVFCILVGSRELVRHWQSSRRVIVTLKDTSIAVSCLLVPIAIGAVFSPTDGETGVTDGWFEYGWKLLHLFNVMLDSWELFDRSALTLVLMALIWGFLIKEARADRGLVLATAILFLCAFIMPSQMLGSHYADIRLFPTLLMIALVSLAPSTKMPARMLASLFLLSFVFVGVRFVGTTAAAQIKGREMERQLSVLDALPEHAQMVMLRARTCAEGLDFRIDRTTHLGGYAIARRGAFSNDQWQIVGAQLLRIHNPALAPFDHDPSQFTFTEPCQDDAGIDAKAATIPAAASHLWVVWEGQPRPLADWRMLAHSDDSILYQRHD